MADQAEGWHTDASGLRVKKWDPHCETRRRGYDKQLQQHQARRLEGATPAFYSSNQPGTLGARGAAARAKAQQTKNARVGRARKFNDRHAEAIVRRRNGAAASQGPAPGQPRHAMGGSHRENDSYMADFRDAYGLEAPAEPTGGLKGAAGTYSRARVASWGARPVGASMNDAMARGPRDPRGSLVDCSDRPLLAMSVSDDGKDIVACGADHAAHGVDVPRIGATPQRSYHGKTKGHREWVTGVAHCGNKAIATCGVDGRLCLWRSPLACEELASADGASSLSVLLADSEKPQLLLAAGYDGTARFFDVGGRRAREVGQLAPGGGGTRAPILCAAWERDACGLGDRDGNVYVYDLTTCARTRLLRPQDAAGHCVALCAFGEFLVSGHQDGRVRGWDPRAHDDRPAWACSAHRSQNGAGAASCVAALSDTIIATCGADRRVCVVDPRAPQALVHAWREHRDFPYCLATLGELIFTGAGDGAVLCHDARGAGACAWGLGAGLSAVRCVDARPGQLAAAGDDGNVIVWEF